MKVTIVGATGGVGRQLLSQARAASYDVIAVARRPEKLPTPASSMTPVQLDFAAPDPAALRLAVSGSHAVLVALGPRPASEAGIVSSAIGQILTAMAEAGARRLLAVSAQAVTTNPASSLAPAQPAGGLMNRRVVAPLARRVYGEIHRDLAETEGLIRTSGLVWTIIRPPRLTNKSGRSDYRLDFAESIPGGRTASRANVAHFMLGAITDSATVSQIVRIAD